MKDIEPPCAGNELTMEPKSKRMPREEKYGEAVGEKMRKEVVVEKRCREWIMLAVSKVRMSEPEWNWQSGFALRDRCFLWGCMELL